jgi:hypothetical protein
MTRPGRTLRYWLCALAAGALGAGALLASAPAADAPSEYQIKAVFVFNFSHFVEWPSKEFGSATAPFVIGIVGEDPFGPRLDEAVRGERIDSHPLIVQRYRNAGEVGDCQILFIARSEEPHLKEILRALNHRATLTVSELDRVAEQGVMIQFVTENNRIRLRVNAEAARVAGLSVSSKLLRLADIVSTTQGD